MTMKAKSGNPKMQLTIGTTTDSGDTAMQLDKSLNMFLTSKQIFKESHQLDRRMLDACLWVTKS